MGLTFRASRIPIAIDMDNEKEGARLIYGRHPVLEALKAGRTINRLQIAKGARGEAVNEIFDLARQASVPYDLVERDRLDCSAGSGHQGVVAFLSGQAYTDYADLLQALPTAPFVLFLDGIQDPHNLGAIIRTAHALGANAVVIPERGAAGLTGTAVKAAAGAAAHIPVCRVKNLQRALNQARDAGLWIAGLDPTASESFITQDFRGPCGLVVGGEGKGIRRLIKETCDFLVAIPMRDTQIGSLNASVAAGVVLYEVLRQRLSDR